MKKNIVLVFVLLILALSEINAKPDLKINIGFFYSSLRNYGEWIEIDRDLFAWRPYNVTYSWKPYTRGRWLWTSYGWYWDSFEPFGWAVYHYGRWYYDDFYGWIWIPDDVWGPAWVEWRYNDNYIGWAPLPPYASFHVSFGIRFSVGWTASYFWWNFVPYKRFCDYRLDYYLLNHRKVEKIFGATKYRNNYYFDRDRIINAGVDRDFIERKAGFRIAQRELTTVEDRNALNRVRNRSDERIFVYKPSEREFERSRNEKFEIKKGERVSSLEREKIYSSSFEIKRNEQNENNNISRNRDDKFYNEPRVTKERENIDRREKEFTPQFDKGSNDNRIRNRELNQPNLERNYQRQIERRREEKLDRQNFRQENNSSQNESRGNFERGNSRENNRSVERRR